MEETVPLVKTGHPVAPAVVWTLPRWTFESTDAQRDIGAFTRVALSPDGTRVLSGSGRPNSQIVGRASGTVC
jgi:hypothetical protein